LIVSKEEKQMGAKLCPQCGGRLGTQIADVLAFVRQQRTCTVRPTTVAEHLGITPTRANEILWTLADRGLIARVRRGVYTGDLEQGRRVLLEQLKKLTPA
jgi:DNA-binding MarR family transcriptional regulator